MVKSNTHTLYLQSTLQLDSDVAIASTAVNITANSSQLETSAVQVATAIIEMLTTPAIENPEVYYTEECKIFISQLLSTQNLHTSCDNVSPCIAKLINLVCSLAV